MQISTIEDVVKDFFSQNPIINDFFASCTIKKGKIINLFNAFTEEFLNNPFLTTEMFSHCEYGKLGQENTISQIQLPMTFLKVVQLKREKLLTSS